jgi:hypothetical protein
VERRPGVHQVAPVVFLAKHEIVANGVETDFEAFEPTRQFAERHAIGVEVQ